MNKEQIAEKYADTIRQSKRLTIAQWRYVYAAFLAALNLELPIETAPRDGTYVLVKDKHIWHVAYWSNENDDSIDAGYWADSINEAKIVNPQCWRPL